jgi:hypothetical protein
VIGIALTAPSRAAGFDGVEVDYVSGVDHDTAVIGAS